MDTCLKLSLLCSSSFSSYYSSHFSFSRLLLLSSVNITNETPEQVMQGAIIILKKNNPDFTLIESAPTTLAGRQAHRMVYDANGRRFMIVLTLEKNRPYQVLYIAEPSKFDSYLPIVQKMLDSFEITANKE